MVHIHLLKRRTGKRSNNYVTVQLKWSLKVKYLSIKAVFLWLQTGLKCLDSSLYLNKKVLSLFPSLKAVFFPQYISGFLDNVPWIGEVAFQRVFEASIQHRRKEDSRDDRRGIPTIVELLQNCSIFFVLLLLFVWLHNLNDILFDQPLYLQWYVPLVKPSSLQKTSWLDLFVFKKRKPVLHSVKRTFNVEYACMIVRWTLRVKKSQNGSVNPGICAFISSPQ